MDTVRELREIVKEEAVIDDTKTCQAYARDQSFVIGRPPEAVVRTSSVEEVQKVVRFCLRKKIPLTPYSSGLNLHGASVPAYGGIVLDLSGMDRIIDINEKDLYAVIEPGVTFEILQNTLTEKSLRIMTPFGVPPARSVLTSYLERDTMMTAASTEYGNFLIHDTELVLPDGELFRTGCWNLGGRPGGLYGPGLNTLHRLWTGAQGTLGIFTKMVISIFPLSPERRFFSIPFESLDEIPRPLKSIQRKEIGWECFGLNRFNLAALLNRDWRIPKRFPAEPVASQGFEKLKASLAPWTVFIGISGLPQFPEDWLAIQQEALLETCSGLGLQIKANSALEPLMLDQSLRPFGILKKFNYRGTVQDLSFKSPLKALPEMEQALTALLKKTGYNPKDLGGYFTVIERGRSVHCEFDLHALSGPFEKNRIKEIWEASGRTLLDRGALFDRPYGAWAEMVYSRAPQYFKKLKQLKAEMDPPGILNPGRLGFTQD